MDNDPSGIIIRYASSGRPRRRYVGFGASLEGSAVYRVAGARRRRAPLLFGLLSPNPLFDAEVVELLDQHAALADQRLGLRIGPVGDRAGRTGNRRAGRRAPAYDLAARLRGDAMNDRIERTSEERK